MFRDMFRDLYFGFGSPWFEEMDRLRREMNRLLASTFESAWPWRRVAPGYPAMNVWANDEGVIITAELPGVNPEDIDIAVDGDTLTLTGSRKPEEHDEEIVYHRRERGYGKFSRVLQLPFQVDVDKVEANFSKGVLSIVLPRAEADKPRKIAVKSA